MDVMGKFTISASMLLTGFAIVFGVLILLIFIIWLYGTIVSNAQNKAIERKKEKEAIKRQELMEAELSQQKSEPASEPKPVVVDEGVPEEIVAVISAAVYTMYGSKQKVKIKSVRRSKSQSEWGRAAILENNQPFGF